MTRQWVPRYHSGRGYLESMLYRLQEAAINLLSTDPNIKRLVKEGLRFSAPLHGLYPIVIDATQPKSTAKLTIEGKVEIRFERILV